MAEVKHNHDEASTYANRRSLSEQRYEANAYTSTLTELQDVTTRLSRLNRYIQVVLADDFLKNATMPSNMALPKALMLNPSYNLLYRIYMVLFHKTASYEVDASYHRYWKQTAQLYEIWTYVQVLKILTEIGFNPVSGWLYDDRQAGQPLPFLTAGTQVHLVGDDLDLNLTYNEPLPHGRAQVTLHRPLMMLAAQNKPDIRLDVFDKEARYLGSLLMDAKYKRLTSILNGLSEGKSSLQWQFSAYVNAPRSPLHDENALLRQMRPVEALLVLYPNNITGSETKVSDDTEANVFYIETKPGTANVTLTEYVMQHLATIGARTRLMAEI